MHHFRPLLTACLLLFTATALSAQDKPTKNPPGYPGPTDAGYVLPNGWRLTPAGQQIILTDLPLNIRTTPDGKYALVACNGYNAHELTAIELATGAGAAVSGLGGGAEMYGLALGALAAGEVMSTLLVGNIRLKVPLGTAIAGAQVLSGLALLIMLVEQHIVGEHTRLLVLHGRFVSAVRQDPAQVVGDGQRTVAALIAAINADRTVELSSRFKKIAIDDEALLFLGRQGLSLDSVPAERRKIILRHTSNTSRGGTN